MRLHTRRWVVEQTAALVLLAVSAVAQLACTPKEKNEKAPEQKRLPEALPTGPITPIDLASDGEYLYWTETSTKMGRIVRSSSDASSLAMLARDDSGPARIAVDDTHVYWSVRFGFVRVPKDGGEPEAICEWASVPAGIAAADGVLYFTDPKRASVFAAEPNKDPIVLAGEMVGVDELVVDPTDVFFTTRSGVLKVPRQGGEPTLLASARRPTAIALDGKNVYFVADGTLSSVPKTGGPASALAKGVGDVKRAAVHRDHVYLAARREIARVPLAGGDRVSLAHVKGTIGNLAVLGDAAYWTDYAAGRVFKLSLR